MASKSLWMDVDVMPAAGSLPGDLECEVAIIGSGIAGLSTAYKLSRRGKSVAVIDRGPIAGGMTSRTSAHLAPLCDDLVSEMTKIKGPAATKLFCDGQAAAVDRIEDIQKREGIDGLVAGLGMALTAAETAYRTSFRPRSASRNEHRCGSRLRHPSHFADG